MTAVDEMGARLLTLLNDGPFECSFGDMTANLSKADRAHAAEALRQLSRSGQLARNVNRRWYSVARNQRMATAFDEVMRQRNAKYAADLDAFLEKHFYHLMARLKAGADGREWLLRFVRHVLGRDLSVEELLRFAGKVNENKGDTK